MVSGPLSDATLRPDEEDDSDDRNVWILVGALLAIGFVVAAAVASAVSLKKKRLREEKKRPRHKPRVRVRSRAHYCCLEHSLPTVYVRFVETAAVGSGVGSLVSRLP